MGRYTHSKNKLARKIGLDLLLKTPGTKSHASLLKRLSIVPGQHGQKLRRKGSDYSRQLLEKQKVKHMYGILEAQFKTYYHRASAYKGVTGEALLRQLEQRLDNVIFRLGFAPTRSSARQLVRHGHVLVSGKKVDIPSYQVSVGEVITIRPRTAEIPYVKKNIHDSTMVPSWLVKKGIAGRVETLPQRVDIQEEINEQLIVEYYSR
jgi:small subunit ribosomal protein S4